MHIIKYPSRFKFKRYTLQTGKLYWEEREQPPGAGRCGNVCFCFKTVPAFKGLLWTQNIPNFLRVLSWNQDAMLFHLEKSPCQNKIQKAIFLTSFFIITRKLLNEPKSPEFYLCHKNILINVFFRCISETNIVLQVNYTSIEKKKFFFEKLSGLKVTNIVWFHILFTYLPTSTASNISIFKNLHQSIHLWPTDFRKGCQDHSIVKERSLQEMVLGQLYSHM